MSGRLVSPTFVGRRDALAAAAELIARTHAGHAAHLLVAGEAGIGKTRFAAEVADLARARGSLVFRGGCVLLGSGELPYAPIVEILREMTHRLDPATLAAAVADDGPVLARITPAMAPGPGSVESVPREAARARMLEALFGTLERLSGSSPVLLIVEDLHWADSPSLDALAFLLRWLRDERIGLLLTFRSDELHRRHPLRPWLGEIERLETVRRLDLGPLEVAETHELIAAIRGDEPAAALVQRIHARSDGNPLFIEELVALGEVPAPASRLSPGLRDILLARIASVSDESQAVLGAAAVAGRHVDGTLLAEVAAVPPDALDACIAECLDRGLLRDDRDPTGDDLSFRHALIQEVVYDGLLPGERVRLHRAVAEALAARIAGSTQPEPGRWAELAHHWDAARDEPRALEAALRAADEAEHAYAFTTALTLYRSALAAWERVADPEAIAGFDRVELLSRAASAAWLQGGDGQIPLLRAAIAEADVRGDVVRGALLRGRLGFTEWATGDPIEMGVVYREALAMMPPGRPTVERARLLAGHGQTLMLEGSARDARRLCDAAIAMAREVGDPRIEGHALNTLGCVLADLGRCDMAAESMERALAIALEQGDPDDIGRAYHNATETLAICGRDERALELVGEGVRRTHEMGLEAVYGIFISLHGAVVAYELGRWDEAARLVEEGRSAGDDPSSEVYALARKVELAVGTGQWDAASTQLKRMDELLGRAEYQFTGPWSCARAELALWQGHTREALAAVEEGLARLERTDDTRFRLRLLRLGLRAAADLAETAHDRRDRDAESEALALADALHARSASAIAGVAEMDGGLALELAAELATTAAEATRLRGASDPVAWHDAAELWSARRRPYRRAYVRWREGEAHLGHGDRAAATAAIREAWDVATLLGARPLGEGIGALARRARIPLEAEPEGTAQPPGQGTDAVAAEASELGLTPRELEVLQLVAQGMTNRQIGDTLFISVHTAGVHVSRILGKLGVAGRTEAASMAYRLGMIRSDEHGT